MSIISNVANYGGRQPDNIQNIKQFVVGVDNQAIWVYKKSNCGINGQSFQTPADSVRPVLINSDLYLQHNLYVQGSIFNPSDKNLKTNIEIIKNDKSDNIINLEPVEFNYKADKLQRKHLGFIAQEVEKIFPELVSGTQNESKSINYIEFIPLLVSKIQNQQKEIDELKEQMHELKEQIHELKEQINLKK